MDKSEQPQFRFVKHLKIDKFGEVNLVTLIADDKSAVVRDFSKAKLLWKILARLIAKREIAALNYANRQCEFSQDQVIAKILYADHQMVVRSFIAGEPLDRAGKQPLEYFDQALELIKAFHAAGLVHRDLEKPQNWLVKSDGSPALLDFQLAKAMNKNSFWFRTAVKDDLRYFAKNKKRLCLEPLSAQEQDWLDQRSWLNRFWKAIVKPCYRFVTRKIFRWSDRGNSQVSR